MGMNHTEDVSSGDESIDREVFIHDLKNIMTGALGHLALIRRRSETGKPIGRSISTVEGILLGACRMAEAALDMDGQDSEQELSAVDILSACSGICVPPDGIEFRLKYEENLPGLMGNPLKLRQLFNNLLTNSVHAMNARGRIEIVMAREKPNRRASDERALTIKIIDSGPGIPFEIREKIFEKGFSTRKGGSGVGLYSAKSWLESIGGDIYFDDLPPGEGCCVVVRLPGTDTVDPRTIPPKVPARHSAGTVLVLEDDPMVTEILGEMLEHIGCDMVGTTDGRKTVGLFQKARDMGKPYLVVILDLNVPGGQGGAETAQQIRALDPDARIFVSSGQQVGEAIQNPEMLGFSGTLNKPFSLEELSRILASD